MVFNEEECKTVVYSLINLNATRKTQLISPLQVIKRDSITRTAALLLIVRVAVRSELKLQVCLSKIVISIL